MNGGEQGNLIPFYMTDDFDNVPRLLQGIQGVKWYRTQARTMAWGMLTDALMASSAEETVLEQVKARIRDLLSRQKDTYLCNPPYDQSTAEPGPPLIVYDPEPEVPDLNNPALQRFVPEDVHLVPSINDSNHPGPAYGEHPRSPRQVRRLRILYALKRAVTDRIFKRRT